MFFRRHQPGQPLAAFIDFFWYYTDWNGNHRREHVLPDGTFEWIINLGDEPRHVFDPEDGTARSSFREAWWSGAHSRYLVIDAHPGASMIGVHFRPGGAAAILGMPASDFRDQVVESRTFWGAQDRELRERLLEAPDPMAKFTLLEMFLLGRLRQARINDQRRRRVAWLLEQLEAEAQPASVRSLARHLGISHKHLVAEFRDEVGLTPKLFSRIRRFQGVLGEIQAGHSVPWVEVAGRCGYYDQAHFVNDFRAFAGVNPSTYLRFEDEAGRFLPVDRLR